MGQFKIVTLVIETLVKTVFMRFYGWCSGDFEIKSRETRKNVVQFRNDVRFPWVCTVAVGDAQQSLRISWDMYLIMHVTLARPSRNPGDDRLISSAFWECIFHFELTNDIMRRSYLCSTNFFCKSLVLTNYVKNRTHCDVKWSLRYVELYCLFTKSKYSEYWKTGSL